MKTKNITHKKMEIRKEANLKKLLYNKLMNKLKDHFMSNFIIYNLITKNNKSMTFTKLFKLNKSFKIRIIIVFLI